MGRMNMWGDGKDEDDSKGFCDAKKRPGMLVKNRKVEGDEVHAGLLF